MRLALLLPKEAVLPESFEDSTQVLSEAAAREEPTRERPAPLGCVVPSGRGRFIHQAMRPSSARDKRSSTSAPRAP